MVTITVGKELDRTSCVTPESSIGHLSVGPIQFLSWLESQLGLELPEVSFTARMVQYLSCLKEKKGFFYEESLKQDEFGVARTLLQWRDTWFEAGWDGDGFDVDASERLLEAGTVEDLSLDFVSPGTGQRVQRVLKSLEDTKFEATVTLLDAPDVFPAVWQQLFKKLGAITDLHELKPQCDGDSDLALLQHALVEKRTPGEKIKLRGDGTVIVLRDGSPQLSAAWIARFASLQNNSDGSVGILAMDYGATLDDALSNAGLPRLGFTDTSYWRPVFQVLPLALELLWRPLDPSILLQFLTHPMGPIPGNVRRPLARVVSKQPGIGSDVWRHAIEATLDKLVEDMEPAPASKRRAELAGDIEYWLDGERFDPQEGIDIELLRERVRHVSLWLSRAFAAQDDTDVAALYSAALGQSDEMLRTLARLRESGTERSSRVSVRRLVEAIRGTGSSRPGRPRQCVPNAPQLLRADSPAGFLAPVPTVIWWGADKERLPIQYPWSRAERTTLAQGGVELLPLNTQLEWQSASWLRPILAATERLVLVLHDDADSHHPVFDEIVAVAEGWSEVRVDRLMRDPELLPISGGLPKTQSIPQKLLPAKRRWWQLPAGMKISGRDEESFSSLEKFLYGPHQWVLQYIARIRPGTLEALDDGPLLRGNLTHELFELFFNVHEDIAAISPDDAEQWAQQQVVVLIEQKGAVLLAPGRQAEKDDFISTVTNALKVLIRHLHDANVASVVMEMQYNGKFIGGSLRGSVDLVATNASGEKAVVDLKWGGREKRRKTLVESSYLQLAVYAQLLNQNEGGWPTLAYFIVSDARMLVLDSNFFPNATIEQPENSESLLEFWQRAETTWKWRRKQLDEGLIEVPVTDTQPDETSSSGELGLTMPETFDQYDDFTVLTGWKDAS